MNALPPAIAAPPRRREAGPALDVSLALKMFRRRLPLFLTILAGATAALVFFSLIVAPTYSATARIKLDPQQRSALSVDFAARNEPPDQALVDTELHIMKSRDIAQAVVASLQLDHLAQFAKGRGGAAGVADRVESRLKVEREGGTYVADMSFTDRDPKLAARIANAFAHEYILGGVETRAATAAEQAAFLGKRLASLSADVQTADARVAGYRERAGISTGGGTETVTDQQIGPLSAQLATAEAMAAAGRSKAQQARAQIAAGGLEAVSGVLNSQTITELRRQRTEVTRNQAEISTRYGPEHPESIKVRQQLEQIDGQIRDEAKRIVSGLDSDALAASAQAAALQAQLGDLKAQQAINARASVEADTLQRDADAKRAMQNQIAQAEQQTSQQEHLGQAQGRIIEAAVPPVKPSFPNRPLFAILGLFSGAFAGAAAVLVLGLADTRVRTIAEVEAETGEPCLGAIPLLTDQQLRATGGPAGDFVINKPLSAYAEAMRNLRGSLQLSGGGSKVVAITSAAPSDGKSTCALSLARVMAMSGDRVLLIECDLRRRALAGVAAVSAPRTRPGLVQVLLGEVPFESAIEGDRVPGLSMLRARDFEASTKDLFSGEPFARLLATARERFDYVVLDTPPVFAVSDARSSSVASDRVILVCRWNRLPKSSLRGVVGLLRQDGASILGIVLSMVDLRDPDVVDASLTGLYHSGRYRDYYEV